MRSTVAAGLTVLAGLAAGSSQADSSVTLGPCRLSQFALELGPLVSEETGQNTIVLRLVNSGRRACVLNGYPRIQAYDVAGMIPFAIRHGGDQMVTTRRPRRLVVRPHGSAFVAVNRYRCDLGNVRTASTLRIGTARAARSALGVVKLNDRDQRLDYCGRGDPGSTLAVSPFEPTLRATLRH